MLADRGARKQMLTVMTGSRALDRERRRSRLPLSQGQRKGPVIQNLITGDRGVDSVP